jgi:transcriptional regulator with XRE-family HTH domain
MANLTPEPAGAPVQGRGEAGGGTYQEALMNRKSIIWLKEELTRRGIARKELAEAVGVTVTVLGSWLNGRCKLTPENEAELIEAMEWISEGSPKWGVKVPTDAEIEQQMEALYACSEAIRNSPDPQALRDAIYREIDGEGDLGDEKPPELISPGGNA